MMLVTEAFVSGKLFDLDLGYAVFTRFRGGDTESGVFMLDAFCLGVKDAFYTWTSEVEYRRTTLDRIPKTAKPS